MKPSLDCIKLIKDFEGCKLEAYQDQGGKWTVGFGVTGTLNGAKIERGFKITQQQAEDSLLERLAAFSGMLDGCIKQILSQNQIDALCCLIYNVGITNFRGSKLLKAINTRNDSDIKINWLNWNHVNGQENKGLTRRRNVEYALFIK